MKAVLMSIQPKWCELIASGKKTIEVRKTRPKLETPFKVYIYMTKNGNNFLGDGEKDWFVSYNFTMAGKVIGEFVCNEIEEYHADDFIYGTYDIGDDEVIRTCLADGLLWEYGKGGNLYGWHISNLIIYDKPKELKEFYKEDFEEVYSNWEDLFTIGVPSDCPVYYPPEPKEKDYIIKRPPQSWCYVEEMVGEE